MDKFEQTIPEETHGGWKEILMEVKGLLVSSNAEDVIPDDQFLLNVVIQSAKRFMVESCLCRTNTKKPIDAYKRDYPVDPVPGFLKVTCVLEWKNHNYGCSNDYGYGYGGQIGSGRYAQNTTNRGQDQWHRMLDGDWTENDGILLLRKEPHYDIKPWGLDIEYAYLPKIDPCEIPDKLKDFRWSQGVFQYAMHYLYGMNAVYGNQTKQQQAKEMMMSIADQAFNMASKFGNYPIYSDDEYNEVRDFLS